MPDEHSIRRNITRKTKSLALMSCAKTTCSGLDLILISGTGSAAQSTVWIWRMKIGKIRGKQTKLFLYCP
jgi:hypothetical protein